MFLLEELGRGASGTMTGFAFTEILVAVYEAFNSGRTARRGEAIFDKYLPLIRYENQPLINLTIRKALLQRRGAIANATPRPPFHPHRRRHAGQKSLAAETRRHRGSNAEAGEFAFDFARVRFDPEFINKVMSMTSAQ